MCDFQEQRQVEEVRAVFPAGGIAAEKILIRPNFVMRAQYNAQGQLLNVSGQTARVTPLELNLVRVEYWDGREEHFDLDDWNVYYVEDKEDFKWLTL